MDEEELAGMLANMGLECGMDEMEAVAEGEASPEVAMKIEGLIRYLRLSEEAFAEFESASQSRWAFYIALCLNSELPFVATEASHFFLDQFNNACSPVLKMVTKEEGSDRRHCRTGDCQNLPHHC